MAFLSGFRKALVLNYRLKIFNLSKHICTFHLILLNSYCKKINFSPKTSIWQIINNLCKRRIYNILSYILAFLNSIILVYYNIAATHILNQQELKGIHLALSWFCRTFLIEIFLNYAEYLAF